mmetsp:Transcript_87714/g.246419  ORF Transcript_87714/g.246419 Transcript_87714/m.246419 type:complete len:196 (-) Transcript_87714:71-658(-)
MRSAIMPVDALLSDHVPWSSMGRGHHEVAWSTISSRPAKTSFIELDANTKDPLRMRHDTGLSRERRAWHVLSSSDDLVSTGAEAAPMRRRLRATAAAFLGDAANKDSLEQVAVQFVAKHPQAMTDLVNNPMIQEVIKNGDGEMSASQIMGLIVKNPKAAFELVQSPLVQDILKDEDMLSRLDAFSSGGVKQAGFL